MGVKLSEELVVATFPTYNEVGTIEELTRSLLSLGCVNWILDVDDGSSDGTLDKLHSLRQEYKNVYILQRPGKLGFGTALRDGFLYALRNFSFARLIQMDADLSHDPEAVPQLLAAETDVVVGSRYVPGGQIVGWGVRRKLISRVANLIARVFLRLNVRDATSGFRVYSPMAARIIGNNARSRGYEFEIEALWLARKHSLSISEVPITFVDREKGESKLGLAEFGRFLRFVVTHIR